MIKRWIITNNIYNVGYHAANSFLVQVADIRKVKKKKEKKVSSRSSFEDGLKQVSSKA